MPRQVYRNVYKTAQMGKVYVYLRKLEKQKSQRAILRAQCGPSGYSSVDWVQACKPKGHQFDSQLGGMPGLQARSPVGDV